MSASFDKKTDNLNRREERALKEQKAKKKTKLISIIVAVVFVLLVAGALFINSKFVRRSMPAISIGGVDFSVAEFNYFYNTAYTEYKSYIEQNLGQEYAASMLPSDQRPHSSQIQNPETGETWADFFNNYATEQMSELVQYYNAAGAAGFKGSEEVRESIESQMEEYRLYAEYAQAPSLDSLFQNMFGPYMNEKCFRKVLEFVNTATLYIASVRDSFTYGADQISTYYAENKEDLDSFTFRYFQVKPATVNESDYATDEEYQAAKTAALEESYAFAATITGAIDSEEDYIAAAKEYDGEQFRKPESTLRVYPGSWLSASYKPWLLDQEREFGNVASIDMDTGSYVVFYISRDANEYNLVKMRQILILREEVNPDEYVAGLDDPGYIEAFQTADAIALERAEIVNNLFIDSGATSEKLAELAAGNSDDTTEGGYYEHISKNSATNKLVPEIEEWLFAQERQVGDHELIRTEEYGYHLVYFEGFGERYCDYLAEVGSDGNGGMKNRDFTAWKETLVPVDAVKRWAYMFV